jgi:8-oxo-dGTP pyrophosphatase MutT (NUDIX family)
MSKIKFLNFSFEYSTGAVIFKKENNKILFLLLHYVSGHWDFVKGKTEKGESDLATLKREALEEAGIDDLKVVADFKKCSYYFYKTRGSEKKSRLREGRGVNIFKKVAFYLAQSEKGSVDMKKIKKSHECQGYTWIEYDKAINRITHPRQQKILKEAMERLQSKKI